MRRSGVVELGGGVWRFGGWGWGLGLGAGSGPGLGMTCNVVLPMEMVTMIVL